MSKPVGVFYDCLTPNRSDWIVLNLDEAVVVLVVQQKLIGVEFHRLPDDRFSFVHLKDVCRRLRFTPLDWSSFFWVAKEQQLDFPGHNYGQHHVFCIFFVLVAVGAYVNRGWSLAHSY